MHPELKNLLYEAEEEYLQGEKFQAFNTQISSLSQRLETYELLRDRELAIFQPIVEQISSDFAQENQKTLEHSLKHWVLIMRYCAMAMLVNNPEFLQHRLLEWLTDLVQTYQLQSIEKAIYQLLQTQLSIFLDEQQRILFQPFLEQAKTTLITDNLAQIQQ